MCVLIWCVLMWSNHIIGDDVMCVCVCVCVCELHVCVCYMCVCM